MSEFKKLFDPRPHVATISVKKKGKGWSSELYEGYEFTNVYSFDDFDDDGASNDDDDEFDDGNGTLEVSACTRIIPYKAQYAKDKSTNTPLRFHSISFMKQYSNKAVDELRLGDYRSNGGSTSKVEEQKYNDLRKWTNVLESTNEDLESEVETLKSDLKDLKKK